jgi:uptake hydrogenase small subunit
VPEKTLLWIGCGGCSGETQALLGVEGQVSDLVDLIDVDGFRLLWHPSLSEQDLGPVYDDLITGRDQLTVLCIEGSIALAEDGMFDIAGEVGKYRIVRSLCERADYVLAMGACAAYGGWQAQSPNPSGAVGLQFTLDAAGGLLPPEWRSRAGMPVICLAGCPVSADTQVAAIRWVMRGTPGGLGRHGTPPMVQPCLPSTEYRGCGTPRRIGMRYTGCTGPKFPNFGDRPMVRWTR